MTLPFALRSLVSLVYGMSVCVGQAVAALPNNAPIAQPAALPRLTIEIKFVEIPEKPEGDIELLQLLGLANEVSIVDWPAAPANLQPGSLPKAPFRGFGKTVPECGMTWTLNASQVRAIMVALQPREGLKIISAPPVAGLSRRTAEIKVADGSPPSARPDLSPELDPLIQVLPEVNRDGYTIRLTVTPTIKEFIGYDLGGHSTLIDFQPSRVDGILNPSMETIPVAIRPEPTSAPRTSLTTPDLQSSPVPIFRSRQFTKSAMVRDGQTLVLGGFTLRNVTSREPVLDGLPLAGRLFRSEASSPNNRNLLIFVTPRLVDPNGKPLHTDQELQVTSPNRR